MERLIVEKTENDVVVLEKDDLSQITLPSCSFDFTVKEGDILLYDGERYQKDERAKEEKKQRLLEIQRRLKEKSENK